MSDEPAGFLSGTDLLHADHNYRGSEVSPSISVTTSKYDRSTLNRVRLKRTISSDQPSGMLLV